MGVSDPAWYGLAQKHDLSSAGSVGDEPIIFLTGFVACPR